VISLLNRFFVPVHITNEEYTEGGNATPEEKALRVRIMREVFASGNNSPIRASDAAFYVLDANGQVVDALKLPDCLDNALVIRFLEKARNKLQVAGGSPVRPPTRQAPRPVTKPDEIALHLTARYIPAGGTWKQLPSEDWILLPKADWEKLLPADGAPVGATWKVDRRLAVKVLSNFYPPSSNRDPDTNRITTPTLTATVVSAENGVTRVRLDSDLHMKHRFLPVQDDNNYVDAKVVGYVDFDAAKQTVREVCIVTEEATYAKDHFGVAVRSVP
jgi:hypothetical protein